MNRPELKQIVLETERLLLKEVNPEIMYNLFTFYNDEEIMKFMGLTTENEMEMERRKFDEGMTTYRISFKSFLLVDKKTNKIIGKTGFHNWYRDHFRAELGYAMSDENYLNRGLMTEANRTVVEYGFDKMGLHRIEAFTGRDNIASLKILRGLGFKEEGVLREHYFRNNRMEDSICFGLLKREYCR